MDKFVKFYSPNVKNLVSSLKHYLWNQNYLSIILAFKYKSGYNYIENNCFPIQ
jgi:hypothetical protein